MASIFDILAQDYTDPRGRFNVGKMARNFTKAGRQEIDAQKELENVARQTALMQQRQEQGVMGQITPEIDPRVTNAKQGAFRFGEEQGAAGILNQGVPGAFVADQSRAGLAEQQAVTEGRDIQNTFNKRSMPFALNDLNELQRRFGLSNPQPLFESQRIGQGQQTIDLQRTGQGLDESYRRDVMARDIFDKNRDRPLNDLQALASTGYMGAGDENIQTAIRNMMVQRGFIPSQQPNQEPGLISSAANQAIGETDNRGGGQPQRTPQKTSQEPRQQSQFRGVIPTVAGGLGSLLKDSFRGAQYTGAPLLQGLLNTRAALFGGDFYSSDDMVPMEENPWPIDRPPGPPPPLQQPPQSPNPLPEAGQRFMEDPNFLAWVLEHKPYQAQEAFPGYSLEELRFLIKQLQQQQTQQ